MSVELACVEDELRGLYAQQRTSEHADADGRVADHAEWRAATAARAERIRVLEREAAGLRRGCEAGDA